MRKSSSNDTTKSRERFLVVAWAAIAATAVLASGVPSVASASTSSAAAEATKKKKIVADGGSRSHQRRGRRGTTAKQQRGEGGINSKSIFGRLNLTEEMVLDFQYARIRERQRQLGEGQQTSHDHHHHHHHHHHDHGDHGESAMSCGFVETPEMKIDMARSIYDWKTEKKRRRERLKKKSKRKGDGDGRRDLVLVAHDVDDDDDDDMTHYVIPVNFYVFVPSDSNEDDDIPYERLRTLVDELNDAFGRKDEDVGGSNSNSRFLYDVVADDDAGQHPGTESYRGRFGFVLNHAYRIVHDDYALCNDENDFMKQFRRGGVDVLNVYLCDAYSQDAAGWARPPPITVHPLTRHYDGVVLMNPYTRRLRANSSWKQNKELFQSVVGTWIHEVGHWMGLLHT